MKVAAVDRFAETTDVVAIETLTGRYVANDIETHNCLPKDSKALLALARQHDVDFSTLRAADRYNDRLRHQARLKQAV